MKLTKDFFCALMAGKLKLEGVEGHSGWLVMDSIGIGYETKTGTAIIEGRAGGVVVATLSHPADLVNGGKLYLASSTGFEMRLYVTLGE